MKYVFAMLACILQAGLLSAQPVRGRVTDAEGRPLGFASVYTRDGKKGTFTNAEGNYVLTLPPGRHTLVCQYVGYARTEKEVVLEGQPVDLPFVLTVQETTLREVVIKSGEDPAYAIIRAAIKKRRAYAADPDRFTCQVYTKGQLSLRDYPKKVLGQKVDFEDGDTSKRKMIFLSETISRYEVQRPDKERVDVISSRVSGQSNGYGLSVPQYLSFYDNNLFIGENLNPRGFISPLADQALQYYRYKLEGTFFENGQLVSRIRVTPRRRYEPLFSGTLAIVDQEWRIHSLQLQLTKQSQMELVDTLRIEQLYRPLDSSRWFIASQVIYPSIKILGFDAWGRFVNVYTEVDINPEFDRRHFGNTVLRYSDSANKRSLSYWEKNRPLPLSEEELRDYVKKDSLEKARSDPRYLDSLEKRRNRLSLTGALFFGHSITRERKRTSWSFESLIDMVNFNPAEGWLVNTGFSWSKRLDSANAGRRRITITPVIRYGFANRHLNPHLTVGYTFGKKYLSSLTISGGKRVFQFNNNSPIGQKGNTLSSLLGEENRIKSYEAWYLRGSWRKGLGDGVSLVLGFQYQDRLPIDNRTDYTWRDRKDRAYTPNYPNEIMTGNITRHQVFVSLLGITWQPGARYIELPDRKINIGSKYPVFGFQYIRNYSNLFGSDADFSKWRLTIRDDMNFKLAGTLSYRAGMGGFLDNDRVEVPDYNHFNGNISRFATEYLNSFQLLPIYQFSNTSRFYALAHLEHNFKGLLTNKIPVVKKLNLYLVTGANAFYLHRPSTNYAEWFVGVDNILKQFRVDWVQSWLNGKPWMSGFRIGLAGFRSQRGDDWP